MLSANVCSNQVATTDSAAGSATSTRKHSSQVVAWIVAGLEGAVEVGALGALGAGLYSIGIPKDSIVKYETALKTDQFLLIVNGTAAEVAQAKDIIETTNPVQFSQHSGGEGAIAA